MAVAKSTITAAPGNTTAGNVIVWSSLASGANNVYFTPGDASKAIILVANINSTDVGTTAGLFYIGTSDSATTGTSGDITYSARRLGRMGVSVQPPTTAAKEALSPSTTAATIAIGVIGPFETARFKDSDGQIQMCKRVATSDAGHVKVAMIEIP